MAFHRGGVWGDWLGLRLGQCFSLLRDSLGCSRLILYLESGMYECETWAPIDTDLRLRCALR